MCEIEPQFGGCEELLDLLGGVSEEECFNSIVVGTGIILGKGSML